MFFDTGAQHSYFQGDSLSTFSSAGVVDDFHPAVGRFQTELHDVPVSLGGVPFGLRCGTLPDPLKAMLEMGRTRGIVGNVILANRTVGYFPRRRTMVL